MSEDAGTFENESFFYGPVVRPRREPAPERQPTILPVDPDAPDDVNARRFFGFTDYEEIDHFRLAARRLAREQYAGTSTSWQTVQHWFAVLAAELHCRKTGPDKPVG